MITIFFCFLNLFFFGIFESIPPSIPASAIHPLIKIIRFQRYNDLLLDNLLKQYYSTKSPHLIISGKWFYRIRKNSIMLKSICEVNIGKDRHVYYDVERFGDNVRYNQKGNVSILNPSSTSTNTIYIIVRLQDLSEIGKVQFHTELGSMIQKYDVKHGVDRCYVVLSIIKTDKQIQKTDPIIVDSDFPLMKRFFAIKLLLKKGITISTQHAPFMVLDMDLNLIGMNMAIPYVNMQIIS